jgi:hypothetical protein
MGGEAGGFVRCPERARGERMKEYFFLEPTLGRTRYFLADDVESQAAREEKSSNDQFAPAVRDRFIALEKRVSELENKKKPIPIKKPRGWFLLKGKIK